MPAPASTCRHCGFHGPPLVARAGVPPWFVLLGLTGIGLLSALVSLVVAAHARRPVCARCLRVDGLSEDWTPPSAEAVALWQTAKTDEVRRFAASQRRNWLIFVAVLAIDVTVVVWLVQQLRGP